MEVYTTGTSHLVLDDTAKKLRLFREGMEIATLDRHSEWKAPLTASVSSRRLMLREEMLDLETLSPIAESDTEPLLEVMRAVALEDGRIVAILRNSQKRGRLAIGETSPRGLNAISWSKKWNLELKEGLLIDGLDPRVPSDRWVGRDAHLSADATTAIVSDGPSGVVARFDLGSGNPTQVLHFGGSDEAELFAEPWGDDLLVISRIAARDSLILRVDRDGTRTELRRDHGIYAHAISPSQIIASVPGEYLVLDRSGAELARTPRTGFIRTSAVSRDGTTVFATKDHLDIVRYDGSLHFESLAM